MRHPRFPKIPWWLTVLTYGFMIVSFTLARQLYNMRVKAVSAPPAVLVTEEVLVVATPTPTPEPTPTSTPVPSPAIAASGSFTVTNGGESVEVSGSNFRSDSVIVISSGEFQQELGTAVDSAGTTLTAQLPAGFLTGIYQLTVLSALHPEDTPGTVSLFVVPVEPSTDEGWRCEFHTNGDFRGIPAFVQDIPDPLDFFYGSGEGPSDGVATLPDEGFGIRCTIEPDFKSGEYLFEAVKVDDFVKVRIDDESQPVLAVRFVDIGHKDNVDIRNKRVVLAGRHRVTVEFGEYGGSAELEFGWRLIRQLPDPTPTPRSSRQEVTP